MTGPPVTTKIENCIMPHRTNNENTPLDDPVCRTNQFDANGIFKYEPKGSDLRCCRF